MKTIVIDARTIDSSTGLYTQYLAYHLNKSWADTYKFVLLVPQKTLSHWRKVYPNLKVTGTTAASYSVAEQTTLVATLERLKPDLVHFTMPQQPFLWLGPAVTTIHDLTLVRHDNIDMNRLVYKMKKGVFISLLRTVVVRAKAIITPTQYVKDDLIAYMGRRYGSKIHFTHEAGEIIDAVPKPVAVLKGKQFLLFVGNAFPYKNVSRIIEAFVDLKKEFPDLHLALAGKKDYFYEQHAAYVAAHDIKDVHFLGFISNDEKRWAFQQSKAYVTASLSEGFNMTTLEALQEGAPLVVSHASCHPEVVGDAGLYFDPYSTEELVSQLRRVLTDTALRDQLIAKGNERIKQFAWATMAKQTVDVYRQALGD